MSRPVTIPRDRHQYLVDFFQKLDRMMTGQQLRVIVRNMGNDTQATTDGKRVWLDWDVLTKPLTTQTRLGLNYQQLARCYFSNPYFDREVHGTKLSQAANILDSARVETLFSEKYPSVVPYFISMVQETMIRDGAVANRSDIWALVYGRKYLPQGSRMAIMPTTEDPNVVLQMTDIIDQFVCLLGTRDDTTQMVELTQSFSTLMSQLRFNLANPGGAKMLRTLTMSLDSKREVARRVRVTVNEDRRYIKKKVRIVDRTSDDKKHTYKSGIGGRDGAVRDAEEFDLVEVDIDELAAGKPVVVSEVQDVIDGNTLSEDVDASKVAPRGDDNLKTEFGAGSSFPCYSEGPGTGGAGGGSLQAVEVLEDNDIDPKYAKLVWVDDIHQNSWARSSEPLNRYKDVLTTSDVRDMCLALEAEVLFDTDQLKKAGWDGFGAVTSGIRGVRDAFDKELVLASRTLKNRFAAGARGNICMKMAMKAERKPDVNIFKSKDRFLDAADLDMELVFLTDASGSMQGHINQALKAQWIIGSSFEKRGAKVTIIPFNNCARDPLKGRDDKFSDRVYPACNADGGTQPHGALVASQEIFDKAGDRMKMLFILTDGAWNAGHDAHKLIDSMNYQGVLTTLVFLGGDGSDYSRLKKDSWHHCKEGFRVNSIDELLPQMRNTFFKTFNRAILRTLRRYY